MDMNLLAKYMVDIVDLCYSRQVLHSQVWETDIEGMCYVSSVGIVEMCCIATNRRWALGTCTKFHNVERNIMVTYCLHCTPFVSMLLGHVRTFLFF